MKKRILCSSLIALGVMFTVLGLSVNAVEAPEEIIPVVTTTLTETTTNTSKATNAVSTASRRMVTTRAATIVTEVPTIVEDNVSDEASEVSEVYEEVPETEVPCEPEPIITEPYIVYKPSTKYLHRNSCRWNSGDAIIITDTNNIEARKCTECNPDIEIVNEYIEPEIPDQTCSVCLSDSDKYYLAIMLTHECSSRAGAEHNAHSVAAMVNRGGAIYSTISSSCCPWWEYGHGSWCMDNGCTNGLDTSYAYEAIDYYLNHSNSYSWVTGWYASGDNIHNSYY